MLTTKSVLSKDFQKADKLFFHDKTVAKLFLWIFPKGIYPNHLTVFRFLATPVVAYFMFFDYYLVGLFLFLIVAFTDVLDGTMARTRDQITEWGKAYDPLADKILIAAMVFTIVLRYIDFWTSIIIIFLEIIIVSVAFARKKHGGKIQANVWGKIKMSLQVLGVVILLLSIVLGWGELLPLANGVLYLAIAFAIVSLLTYGI